MAEQRYEILPPASTTPEQRYEILPTEEADSKVAEFLPEFLQGRFEGNAIQEIGEGIASGFIKAGEGVLSGVGLISDTVAGTDYADTVTEKAEDLRDYLGLDPEGILGKGAEVVAQFVVPGVKVASSVGKAAMAARKLAGKTGKLSKTERANLALRELGAVAGVEMAVSGDNTTTIGDWVEMGPTQTTDLIGLEGMEKNLARIGNRLKIFGEAGVIGGVAQAGLSKVGKTIGDANFTKVGAEATRNKIDQVSNWANDLVEKRALNTPGQEISNFQGRIADAISFGRYRGSMPEQVADKRLLLDGQIKPQLDFAERTLNNIETDLDALMKKLPEGGSLDKAGALNKVLSYMREADPKAKTDLLNALPKEIRTNARVLRTHVDTLSNDVLDSNFLRDNNFVTKDGRNIKDVISDGLGSYVRRSYKIFEDAKYTPDADTIKVADKYFLKNKTLVQKELTELARGDVDNVFNDDFMKANGLARKGVGDTQEILVQGKVTPALAAKARQGFLDKYSIKNTDKLKGGFVAKDRLDTGMFITREDIKPELRRLLGEIDDPRAAILGTVTDLAQFSAVDDYFGTVAKMAKSNQGIGKFFKDGAGLTALQKKALTQRGFVKLGGDDGASSVIGKVGGKADDVEQAIGRSGWGSLDGFYVPKSIYKDLTNQVLGETSIGGDVLRGALGMALKGKGISQYSKTVLSPVTQIRNLTTALAFATANGNWPALGRGGDMKDALTAVTANVFNKGSENVFADLADAQRRGVLGTNAELREIQDQLNKGIGSTGADAPKNFVEAIKGKPVASKAAKSIGKVAKGFESAYQASDDIWKYYSYNAEQAKIRNALDGVSEADQIKYLTKNMDDVSIEASEAIKRGSADIDDLIKARAAQIVRDTVPNYNKGASELIKLGRKLPFGNFITFPAEMYRTSFNIVKQGLDDMASDIPAIRARGRQRLLGFGMTTALVPAAALEAGYQLSGVSREEMEAFKRSFGAPWMKGATLIPTGRTEDGKIEYVNFSTFNPYDVLSRFANRAITESDAAMIEGKDPDQVFMDVGLATLGEAFAPFLDEAMLTDALLDISYRGGKTSTGAKVYNPEDGGATMLFKIAGHVANTMIPNILAAADISGGKIEASRAVRGLLGDGLGIDAIASQDKMGRQRTWKKELARLSTGVSSQEFDPEQGLRFAAYGFSQGQTDAKRMFNSLTDDFNVTGPQLLQGFEAANAAKFRNDRGYYRMIQDLRIMGMEERDILKVLKQNNIGGIKGIMRGEFEPFKLTSDAAKKLQRVGRFDQLPVDAIRDVMQNMRGMPLDPDAVDTRSPAAAPAQPRYEVLPPAAAPAQPRYEILPPQREGSLPQPTLPITTARAPGPVNPALLGGTPAERAANAFLQT